eukprot:599597-Pyramimonas_sp.AAC.2
MGSRVKCCPLAMRCIVHLGKLAHSHTHVLITPLTVGGSQCVFAGGCRAHGALFKQRAQASSRGERSSPV